MTAHSPHLLAQHPPLIAPRPAEDDDEQMFRESMERLGAKLMATLDAQVGLRTAASDTQRSRHLVRGAVVTALTQAMNTYYLHRLLGPVRATATPRSK